MKDTLVIGGHEFQSRFILGSGKYSLDLINAAVQNAGAQIITLALRRAGIRTEADYQGRSLKAQFKQADKHNASLCVVIGPDEVAAHTATIRDMGTHEQVSVPMDELAARVAERLA